MEFWIDTTGDFDAPQYIPLRETPDFVPFQEDFVPLRTTKKERRQFNKKQKRIEEDLVLQDYLENCEDMDVYISKVQSLNLEDEQSDGEQGWFEQLMEGDDLELESGEKLDVYSDTSSLFERNLQMALDQDSESETNEIRRDFEGRQSAWDLSPSYLEEANKQEIFERQVNGDFERTNVPQQLSRTQRRKLLKRERKQMKKIKNEGLQKRKKQTDELFRILSDQDSRRIGGDLLKFLQNINGAIHQFVSDSSEPEYMVVASMPAGVRRIVNEMAKKYIVVPKTNGKGNKKTILIYRTRMSFVPLNWKSIPSQLVAKVPTIKGPMGNHKSMKQKGGSPKKTVVVDTKPKHGDVVGKNAKPVDESNVGHKMMRMMGWKPGESLGAEKDGIAEPVKVVVRGRGVGLGA